MGSKRDPGQMLLELEWGGSKGEGRYILGGETWIRTELTAGVVCHVAAHEDELGVRCTGKAADVVVRCSIRCST